MNIKLWLAEKNKNSTKCILKETIIFGIQCTTKDKIKYYNSCSDIVLIWKQFYAAVGNNIKTI